MSMLTNDKNTSPECSVLLKLALKKIENAGQVTCVYVLELEGVDFPRISIVTLYSFAHLDPREIKREVSVCVCV